MKEPAAANFLTENEPPKQQYIDPVPNCYFENKKPTLGTRSPVAAEKPAVWLYEKNDEPKQLPNPLAAIKENKSQYFPVNPINLQK